MASSCLRAKEKKKEVHETAKITVLRRQKWNSGSVGKVDPAAYPRPPGGTLEICPQRMGTWG